MKTIWQGVPASGDRGGWFMGGGWAARTVAAEGGEPGPNPNLLLWTEEFDSPVWVKGGTLAVIPNVKENPSPPGDGGMTADLLTGASADAMTQDSIVATVGDPALSGSTVLTTTAAYTRVMVTGTFDGLSYSLSYYGRAVSGFVRMRAGLAIVGGKLQAQMVLSTAGTGAWIWGAQLEQAAAPTAYQKREGT